MDTGVIISLICSVVMAIVGITTFILAQTRAGKKNTQENLEGIASLREGILKVDLKLDQICVTVNETRSDVKATDKKLMEHSEAIAVLKHDLQTAFLRINELRESKIDKYGGQNGQN